MDEAKADAEHAAMILPTRKLYRERMAWFIQNAPNIERWENFKNNPTVSEALVYTYSYVYRNPVTVVGGFLAFVGASPVVPFVAAIAKARRAARLAASRSASGACDCRLAESACSHPSRH